MTAPSFPGRTIRALAALLRHASAECGCTGDDVHGVHIRALEKLNDLEHDEHTLARQVQALWEALEQHGHSPGPGLCAHGDGEWCPGCCALTATDAALAEMGLS